MVSGLTLVASYFITSLANVITELEPIAQLSPLTYYQGGEALDGLNLTWVIGLVLPALVFAVLAWWRFERRDIRVGGEGGWERPTLFSRVRFRRSSSGSVPRVPDSAAVQH